MSEKNEQQAPLECREKNIDRAREIHIPGELNT